LLHLSRKFYIMRKALKKNIAAFVALLSIVAPGIASADTQLIGNTSDTCSSNIAANYFLAEKFTASTTGVVTKIRARADASGLGNVGIYSDSAGAPNNRLTYVDDATIAIGWNEITVPSYTLNSGTDYWLAADMSNSGLCYDGTLGTGGCMGYYARNQSLGLPSVASALTGGVYCRMNLQGWEISASPSPSATSTDLDASNVGSASLLVFFAFIVFGFGVYLTIWLIRQFFN